LVQLRLTHRRVAQPRSQPGEELLACLRLERDERICGSCGGVCPLPFSLGGGGRSRCWRLVIAYGERRRGQCVVGCASSSTLRCGLRLLGGLPVPSFALLGNGQTFREVHWSLPLCLAPQLRPERRTVIGLNRA